MDISALVVLVMIIAAALAFDFTNGFHDTANAMATSIATGALKPRTAVFLAGVLNLIGAFVSTDVAKTISGGIINEQAVTIAPEFIFAGLVGAILWNLITWLVGLPSSSSHAMLGGLVGAIIAGAGIQGIDASAIGMKILMPAVVSPIIAGSAAFVTAKIIYLVVKNLDPDYVERGFRRGQTVTACLVALSHGTNDAQKTMGVITLALIAVGLQPAGTTPQFWVIVICAAAIVSGTAIGGWRIIRTLGKGLTEISTPQGFAAESSAAITIMVSSHVGFPLSTTQVCSGSIIGSGLGKRDGKINWKVAGRMAIAWLITFPAAGAIGALACFITSAGLGGSIAVAVIALCLTGFIVHLSRRNPVTANNVNDGDSVSISQADSSEAAKPAER